MKTSTIRFVMIGGFLGAGKTTLLARLARHYQEQGLRVGVVTNDQAQDLVDTNSLRAQGFDVGEVAGACFCCRFTDLMETMEKLGADQAPDMILAEPVGSCTDLVATVIQPIQQLYQSRFSIAPYAVLLKPAQGRRILRGDAGGGFSPKAAYILEKQLEEADVILINRADELRPDEVRELHELLERRYPHTPRLLISGKTGIGCDALLELLDQQGDFGRRVLEIDYDTYAEGEAELGWLNGNVRCEAAAPFEVDRFLVDVIDQLRTRLVAANFEAAHLKAIGLWDGFFGVANLISTTVPVELSLPSQGRTNALDLVVNARVACDPEWLSEQVQATLQQVAPQHGITLRDYHDQKFRPGRPTPTHRMQPQQG